MRRQADNDRAVTWSISKKMQLSRVCSSKHFLEANIFPLRSQVQFFKEKRDDHGRVTPDVIIYLLLNVRDIAVADRRAVRDPISGPKNRDIRIPSGGRAGSVAAPRRRATRSRALRRARSNSSSRFLRYPQYDDRSIRRASAMVFLHSGRGPNK